jgi:hypothetical protein
MGIRLERIQQRPVPVEQDIFNRVLIFRCHHHSVAVVRNGKVLLHVAGSKVTQNWLLAKLQLGGIYVGQPLLAVPQRFTRGSADSQEWLSY